MSVQFTDNCPRACRKVAGSANRRLQAFPPAYTVTAFLAGFRTSTRRTQAYNLIW